MGFYIHFISPQLILTIIPRKMDSLGPVTVTGLITNTVSVPHCNVIFAVLVTSALTSYQVTSQPNPAGVGRHSLQGVTTPHSTSPCEGWWSRGCSW